MDNGMRDQPPSGWPSHFRGDHLRTDDANRTGTTIEVEYGPGTSDRAEEEEGAKRFKSRMNRGENN